MKKHLSLIIILNCFAVSFPAAAQSKPPSLNAEEIGNRMIKLVKLVKTRNDNPPENVERQIQIKVFFNETDRNIYGFCGNIENASSWSYNFYAHLPSAQFVERAETLRFSKSFPIYDVHEPLCSWHFERGETLVSILLNDV